MKKHLTILLFLSIMGCDSQDNLSLSDSTTVFYKGMDLSFQSELENYDISYKNEQNQAVSLLPYVASKGCNLVRLRIWHTPQDGQNGLAAVKDYALKIKQNNMKFLLDFHYSDYWADPAQQTPPIEWQNKTLDEVKTLLYLYTKEVMQVLKDQETLPEMVQIGNETDSGFLWNYGKVWNEFNGNWSNYASLVENAILGVRDVAGRETQILLHHSNVENAHYFFTELQDYRLDYDVIGLSYYPQFQIRDLNLVQSKLNALAATFQKKILLAEVAYPFTLEWNDSSTNFIGFQSQLHPDYPATPQGQKLFMQKMVEIIKNIPDEKGIGFVYWAPDWVAFPNNQNTSTAGTSWENQCLWNFEYKALPAMSVFME